MLDILMILVLAQWGSHSIYLIPLLLDKLFNLPNAWYIVSVLCIRSCYDHLLMEDTLLAVGYVLAYSFVNTSERKYFGKTNVKLQY